jgi:hypothetical protein
VEFGRWLVWLSGRVASCPEPRVCASVRVCLVCVCGCVVLLCCGFLSRFSSKWNEAQLSCVFSRKKEILHFIHVTLYIY